MFWMCGESEGYPDKWNIAGKNGGEKITKKANKTMAGRSKEKTGPSRNALWGGNMSEKPGGCELIISLQWVNSLRDSIFRKIKYP